MDVWARQLQLKTVLYSWRTIRCDIFKDGKKETARNKSNDLIKGT